MTVLSYLLNAAREVIGEVMYAVSVLSSEECCGWRLDLNKRRVIGDLILQQEVDYPAV